MNTINNIPGGYEYKIKPDPKERGVVSIYALVDPRNDEIKYIGQSNTPQARRGAHIRGAGKSKRIESWVLELNSAGYSPDMFVLREVPEMEADNQEKHYINLLLSNGASLLNTVLCDKKGVRSGKFKHSIKTMQAIAEYHNGLCVSNEYNGTSVKLLWRCKDGHEWEARPSSVINGTWCNNARCKTAKRAFDIEVIRADIQKIIKRVNTPVFN